MDDYDSESSISLSWWKEDHVKVGWLPVRLLSLVKITFSFVAYTRYRMNKYSNKQIIAVMKKKTITSDRFSQFYHKNLLDQVSVNSNRESRIYCVYLKI